MLHCQTKCFISSCARTAYYIALFLYAVTIVIFLIKTFNVFKDSVMNPEDEVAEEDPVPSYL